MTIDEAIAVFDKSADPNAQTEAWAVIRAELANPDRLQVTNMLVLCGEREVRNVDGLPQKLRALIDGLITQRQRAVAAEQDARTAVGLLREVADEQIEPPQTESLIARIDAFLAAIDAAIAQQEAAHA